MSSVPSTWDLLVIGAGIYGIQVARTYLELHPTDRVVVLEASNSVGGVWSKERVYNDFWTQTPIGLLEFSDRPIHAIPRTDQYYGFFKAHHVVKYLEEYCEKHVYDGASLRPRVRTDEPVFSVRKVDGVWHVHTISGTIYRTPRIIDASGLTSRPKYPQLPDQASFEGTVIHHKDFAKWESQLDTDSIQNIVVIGGAKSAADAAYSCTKNGHRVTWLIRRSGFGPAALVSAKGKMGYANSNESFYTRLTSLFLVSLFTLGTGYDRVLGYINRTTLGQRLLRSIWQGINAKAWKRADYDRADGQPNGFYNLKPDTELFWQNDSTGINQRPDFFDTIARHVRVFREDISRLCKSGVVLDTEKTLGADTIICATGWRLEHPYFNEEMATKLGLPVSEVALLSEARAYLDKLDIKADQQVVIDFPILDSDWAQANDKRRQSDHGTTTPFRLWKSIVPTRDPSYLFVGKLMLGNHFRAAEVQALFACGVLDGAVELPPTEEMDQDISRTLAWCRRRYLKKGALGNWFYWDMVPYTDSLLRQIGLSSHRHASWWKDLVAPCYARDLKGLIDEYRDKLAEK